MATEVGLDTRYNLIDMLKLVKDNRFVPFAEVLTENNPLLFDLPVLPANGILSHEGSRETSLPTPQIIKVGAGHSASTIRWDQYKEEISIFKDRVVIPEDTGILMADFPAFRAKVEDRHAEGFGQGVTNHIIYGTSVASPEKFDGLDVRYSVPDATDPTNPSSASADFAVFDMAGSGDDTMSMWLIQPGIDKIHLITPANDPNMGLKTEDMGRVYAFDQDGTLERLEHRTELRWTVGLNIVDMRSVARIRNIETAVANLDAAVLNLIFQAEEETFKGNEQIFLYVPKRMMTFFHIMAEAKQNVIYDKENIYGIFLLRIGKILIRTMDALNLTETSVSAV